MKLDAGDQWYNAARETLPDVARPFPGPVTQIRESTIIGVAFTKGLESASGVLAGEDWLPTPLLPAGLIGSRLGLDLWLKREDCTPTGSFKLRGGLVAMAHLGESLPPEGVYVASVGNYGVAIAFAAQRAGVKAAVYAPADATPSKLARIRLHLAEVRLRGRDYEAARDAAVHEAAEHQATFWQDGVIAEMEWGAATIASEILAQAGRWDAVVVPIGGGSLIKGIASAVKDRSPHTRLIGVVASGAPAVAHAFHGRPWDTDAPVATWADGISVRVPLPGMVYDLKRLVDDVWVVEEPRILSSVRSLMELEQVMVEPAAAITVAGIADHRAELAGKRVAAVLTGAHLNMALVPEVLAATPLIEEGRR